MEGWGTYAPITVRFDRGPGVSAPTAAIDLNEIHLRMEADGWDPSNDSVYLVNLTTGVPVLLDVGSGNYPLTVISNTEYYPNDPRINEQNLVFETANEAVGACADGVYRPQCDTDFDGVLDRPDTLGPAKQYDGVDNLMTWYERQTDTLVLQPILPMQEKTSTPSSSPTGSPAPMDKPVRSPFPDINHPAQTASVARLQGILGDPTLTSYYGDIAGTGFAHVAFAWTFTTEPVQEDLLLLRDGLYGQGPSRASRPTSPRRRSRRSPRWARRCRRRTSRRAGRARPRAPRWRRRPTSCTGPTRRPTSARSSSTSSRSIPRSSPRSRTASTPTSTTSSSAPTTRRT